MARLVPALRVRGLRNFGKRENQRLGYRRRKAIVNPVVLTANQSKTAVL